MNKRDRYLLLILKHQKTNKQCALLLIELNRLNLKILISSFNKNGYLKAYNTDCIALYHYLEDKKIKSLTILGNGGFSKALQYACKYLNIKYSVVLRHNFDNVPNLKGWIFNATPADVEVKGTLIDGRPFTDEGKEIARLQAEEQYKIYTN